MGYVKFKKVMPVYCDANKNSNDVFQKDPTKKLFRVCYILQSLPVCPSSCEVL